MRRHFVEYLMISLFISVCSGCGKFEASRREKRTSREQWKTAQRLWQQRDVHAYSAWMAIDPKSHQGMVARNLLARAEVHYLDGIRLFRDQNTAAARNAFIKGAAIAPIDPIHYLPLARIYKQRGLQESAAKYYRKYIEALPDAAHISEVRSELAKLDLGLGEVFDPPKSDAFRTTQQQPHWALSQLFAAVSMTSIAVFVLLLLIGLWRSRGVSLDRLIEKNPELHSAIAYLLGSLRHELLKHRIGAVSDVLAVSGPIKVNAEQRIFLKNRLFGGVPLLQAWDAHLLAFVRVLGDRLNLYRDSAFRRARRAIRTLSTLQPLLNGLDSKIVQKLKQAHAELIGFDQALAFKQRQLVRTRIDDFLFNQVLGEVRGEYATSSIALDELGFRAIDRAIEVEVARIDLVLILKNIIRNAILAVGREPDDRRVHIEVRVELEPTGEEAVRICVADSSREPLATDAIYSREMDSGLGLVNMAVNRYNGAIEVNPGRNGYAKEVAIRFFRAFEDS